MGIDYDEATDCAMFAKGAQHNNLAGSPASIQQPRPALELAVGLSNLVRALGQRIELLDRGLTCGPDEPRPTNTVNVPQPPMGLNERLAECIETLELAHVRVNHIARYLGLEV